jgi:predicted membrane-bound spermidine synthase
MAVKNKPLPLAPTAAAAPAPALSPGLRRYVYVTAAFTGAAIMIVEILGAKMLSPFVGMSHFVWTAQIAITLVALACGYYAGGRLADRSQQLAWLYWAILGAAAYLSLTVLICRPIAFWCLDYNLALGSLLASGILFFAPLALLAMTGPFLVRVITASVAGVGGNVGRLTAISTLGSLAGTLLIGYVLIPLLPNSITMYVTALALGIISLGYFAVWQRKASVAPVLVGALVAGVGSWLGFGTRPEPHLFVEDFHGNSFFGQLEVVTSRMRPARYYLNDNLIQNSYDCDRKQSMSHFTYMLSGLTESYNTNLQDVLCIGLGVGIVPMEFANQGARVDVVEINPAVVPVGVKFFNLQPQRLHLTIDDARHFLNRCNKHYDAVVMDAFLGDSSPSHLMTSEAFESIRKVLRPGGTLAINAFCDLHEGRDFFAASLYKTLKAVFQTVRIHSRGEGQSFFVASDRPSLSFVHPPDFSSVHPEALDDTKAAFEQTIDTSPESGRILTDNYNPVEFYDARNREALRRILAKNARDM